ncbi:unnamed protein product [Rhizoctonia solani]|uniref:chitin deacetylase n=1 Tax=Rhizoctonia solani TaxID=456999 RepID=A0A8H3B8X7_9AGAM|nr:unnamed protein product [Rhizoctonia solani]
MLTVTALCSSLALTAVASWDHDPRLADHSVHKLFSRQATFAPVGSVEWRSKFPKGSLGAIATPQAWLDAMNTAITDGRIPSYENVPVAVTSGTYHSNNGTALNGSKTPICSSAAGCKDDTQIYDAPDGIVAISFDDGPLLASLALYKFLRVNNQKATHFFIGSNILANPEIFREAFEVNGDDIAVHTWSHPQMTTLTNEMVLAELGWTCQIIHDSTGGRLPRYWRPPYGDSDSRVRAIAREVFGLQTVIWNGDTNNWNIPEGSQTLSGAKAILTNRYTGLKSPGLNILEHEVANITVQVFTDTYQLIAENGWQAKSIPDAMGASWYLNSKDDTSPVTSRAVAGGVSDASVAEALDSGRSPATIGGPKSGPAATPKGKSSGSGRRAVSSALGLVLFAMVILA